MSRKTAPTLRVLAFDTSMGRPGAAVVQVRNGKPEVVAVSHVATSTKMNHGQRAELIDAWATLFIAEHGPYDVIVREDFSGKTSRQSHPVFAAWGACDRALNKFGLKFTTAPIAQQTVKKVVVGVGKAEKDEVAEAVRKWTGYKGEFAVDDESDACAIALAYLIREGAIG